MIETAIKQNSAENINYLTKDIVTYPLERTNFITDTTLYNLYRPQ